MLKEFSSLGNFLEKNKPKGAPYDIKWEETPEWVRVCPLDSAVWSFLNREGKRALNGLTPKLGKELKSFSFGEVQQRTLREIRRRFKYNELDFEEYFREMAFSWFSHNRIKIV